MRDKKLTVEENWKMNMMDKPDIPNDIPGDTIMMYKMHCSLLEQLVRLDAEIELLKGGK
jgi:hypothetical protein